MRILFDTAPLADTPAGNAYSVGVQRACHGLLRALEARGRLEVVRAAPRPDEAERRWRQRGVPALLRESGADGFHSCVSAFPLRGPGRRVQTLHELPWRAGVSENADWRHRAWASLGPVFADAVLCPSEHTARLLSRRLLPGRSKIHVCPWGVEPRFQDEPAPGEIDEVLLERYHLPEGPFALCLGAVRAKKNLPALLRGLAHHLESGERGLHVVITGNETADLRRDLGLVSRLRLSRWIRTPGFVRDEDLPGLLRLATVVVVLSPSEGFAFPVLEALACGTPVLVAGDTAQSELAGAMGFAVDPADPAAVAAGLARAVREREDLRYQLSERARDYTWDRCAEQVEDLWLGWQR